MKTSKNPKNPSLSTVKRLFAVSGNLCASPKCSTLLIDPKSGSVVGEVCHIKGDKPGAARYDENQSDKERHGFDNLLLLCNVHHKIVDDDEAEYTVERLLQMKKEHEARHKGPPPVDKATAERFATVAITNSTVHGSVVASHGQTGGQTAHVIHNYGNTPPSEERILLDAKLSPAGDLELLQAIGCPGMRLTVICRGTRPAKIRAAHLFIEDVDVMKGMQEGFDSNLGYTPLPGSSQTMVVKLIPLSRPNSPEGYVLNRDDVCRFFYPLPMPPTTLALQAKPENLSMGVTFFDDSEQTLGLKGQEVQHVLKDLFEMFRERPGQLNPAIAVEISVQVKSTTLPKDIANIIGKVNPKYIPMANPDEPGGK
jgi:hypothetical protein